MDDNLEYKKIKSIKRLKKKQKVYNFNVPGYENYVANGFIVHNCENWQISQQDLQVKSFHYDPLQLVTMAKQSDCDSICMTFNEPTIHYEFLIELGEECHKNDLKFIIKTNAYVEERPWRYICLVADAINIDWKGSEESFYSIAGVKHYVIKDRIRQACNNWAIRFANPHIEISIPLYFSDDKIEEEMEMIGKFISEDLVRPTIPCHLLRVSPSYKYEDFVFNSDNLTMAYLILSKYVKNVYKGV